MFDNRRKDKIRRAVREVIETNDERFVIGEGLTASGVAFALRKLHPKKGRKEIHEMLLRVMKRVQEKEKAASRKLTDNDVSFLSSMEIKLRD